MLRKSVNAHFQLLLHRDVRIQLNVDCLNLQKSSDLGNSASLLH